MTDQALVEIVVAEPFVLAVLLRTTRNFSTPATTSQAHYLVIFIITSIISIPLPWRHRRHIFIVRYVVLLQLEEISWDLGLPASSGPALR